MHDDDDNIYDNLICTAKSAIANNDDDNICNNVN